jgi:hypothetical protein
MAMTTHGELRIAPFRKATGRKPPDLLAGAFGDAPLLPASDGVVADSGMAGSPLGSMRSGRIINGTRRRVASF